MVPMTGPLLTAGPLSALSLVAMASCHTSSAAPRAIPGRHPLRGVVGIIRQGGRYLMIRRAWHLAAGGGWCFPGGAIEAGESSGEAIVREVAEEIGLPGRAIEQVWEWTREDGGLVLDWWRVEPLGNLILPNPAEVVEFRWMTEAEIRNTPGVLPGLIEFLNHFSGAGCS